VIGIALGHLLYFVAIKRPGAAAPAGVLQLQPVCAGMASYFVFGEVLAPAQWASGASAVAGAVAILFVEQRTRKLSSGRYRQAENGSSDPAAAPPGIA
jgi:drug/metabolite transporter (DMT)-like permease